jgi:hypothetical protein
MPARRKTTRRTQKFSTRLKKNPIGTVKSEFNKMGPVGKTATVGIVAGALSPQIASSLNKLPVVGKFMKVFTQAGMKLRMRLK